MDVIQSAIRVPNWNTIRCILKLADWTPYAMSLDPEKVGRYEVQCVLGRGAMGVVYLALDPLLKRSVAVKTMRDNGEDVTNTMERFKREAEISARLNHPNIITVFDVGVDNEMGPFLAMEYIQGASLAHLIKENLPMDVGLRLLLQASAALKAAEQAGIVHRDVKPENMLVSLEGRLKLMDFGIARGDQSRLTAAGMVFGTPSYTAPELLVGGDPSYATDRYAFAVTAFEVFTGTLPYLGTSVGTTLYRIVHEPPKMPATLHPKLQEVFLRAMGKDPDQRFSDLSGFMWALISAAPIAQDQKSKLLDSLDNDKGGTGSFNFTGLPKSDPAMPSSRTSSSNAGSMAGSQSISARAPTLVTPADGIALRATGFAPTVPQPRLPSGPIEELGEPIPEPALPTASEVIADMNASNASMGSEYETHPGFPVQLSNFDELEQPTLPVGVPMVHPKKKKSHRLLWVGLTTLALGGAAAGFFFMKTTKHAPRMVDILSEPSGAKVFLEGQPVGETPLSQVELSDKAASLKFELPGYQPASYRIKEGETKVQVRLELPPHTIAVATDPDGASVFLNGKLMGKSPLASLGIPTEGQQTLRITKDGYRDWQADVDPTLPFPDLIRMNPLPKARR